MQFEVHAHWSKQRKQQKILRQLEALIVQTQTIIKLLNNNNKIIKRQNYQKYVFKQTITISLFKLPISQMQSQKSGIRLRHLQQKNYAPVNQKYEIMVNNQTQDIGELKAKKYHRQQSTSPYGQRKKIFQTITASYSQSSNKVQKIRQPISNIWNAKTPQFVNDELHNQLNQNFHNNSKINHYQYQQMLTRKNIQLRQKQQIIKKLHQRVKVLQGENFNYKQQLRKIRVEGLQKANLQLNSQNASDYDDYQREQKSFRTQTSYNTVKNNNRNNPKVMNLRQKIVRSPIKTSHIHSQNNRNNQDLYNKTQQTNPKGVPVLPQTPDQRNPWGQIPQKHFNLRAARQPQNSINYEKQREGNSKSPYRGNYTSSKQSNRYNHKNHTGSNNEYHHRQMQQATISILNDSENQYQSQIQDKDIVSPLMALDSKKGTLTKKNHSRSQRAYSNGNGFNGQNSFGRSYYEENGNSSANIGKKKANQIPSSRNLHIDDSLQYRFEDNNSELSDFHSGFLF